MLEASDAQTLDTQPAQDAVLVSRDLLERMQAELQFEKTRNEALNFEIARLKRWRFGSSSESLDATTQSVLFGAIVADTLLEDIAAQQETKPPPSAPHTKRQAVRQALPASLPRIDRHHEIEQTHCACGQAFKRIGEEVSEQLDCVPAQFFVLRHIRWPSTPVRAARRSRPRRCPRRSSTRASRPRACWPRWWWPSTTIICRCIGRPRFTHARGCISHARAWRSGWGSAACDWRRWSMR